jgi:transcriptional regulator with XRE-family HTH domain
MSREKMNKNNFDLTEIGARLKKARKTIDRTQIQIAKMCDLPTSTISEMESGLRRPHARYLFLLVSEFNVNLNWIFTGKGLMFLDFEIKVDFGLDNELVKELIRLIEISPSLRYKVLSDVIEWKKTENSTNETTRKKK